MKLSLSRIQYPSHRPCVFSHCLATTQSCTVQVQVSNYIHIVCFNKCCWIKAELEGSTRLYCDEGERRAAHPCCAVLRPVLYSKHGSGLLDGALGQAVCGVGANHNSLEQVLSCPVIPLPVVLCAGIPMVMKKRERRMRTTVPADASFIFHPTQTKPSC